MLIKFYDLNKEGLNFKKDFNDFKRVLKVLDERQNNSYRKIDLVTDSTKKLFLCKRFANFANSSARMDLKEIENIICL